MTDNELLFAISNMIEPLKKEVQDFKDELRGDIHSVGHEMQNFKDNLQTLKDDLQGVKDDLQGVKDDLQGVKDDLQGVKDDLQGVKDDLREVKDRVKKIEMTQEIIILPRLDTIEACYTSTYYRYKEQVETYESMKQDISILKSIVAEHSEKLQKIS